MDESPILIFKDEIDCGISDRIQANRSIAYIQPVLSNPVIYDLDFTVAGKKVESADLYYTESILVSTVWNLNDDVFDPVETWLARKTPEDQRDNLDHDETKVVGHTTGNYCVNDKGETIPDDTELNDLPSLFHIVNSGVIYKSWTKEELVEQAKKLIGEIEENKRFVSMECRFGGFDYALMNSKGEISVVERNDSTSFLSKYLRAYEGKGSYQDYRIGRVMRKIRFVGKGYVYEPANPQSIIFSSATNSLLNYVKKDVGFVKGGVCSLQTPKVSQILENNKESIMNEQEVAELKSTNETLKAANESLNKDKGELVAQVETLRTEIASLKEEINKLVEAGKVTATELNEVKASNLKIKRISDLVGAGIENTVAEAKATLFSNLNDEQFKAVADELIEATKVKASKNDSEDKSKAEKEALEAKAAKEADEAKKLKDAADALANASKTQPVFVPKTEEEETAIAKVRQDLQGVFEKMLAGKQKTKISK